MACARRRQTKGMRHCRKEAIGGMGGAKRAHSVLLFSALSLSLFSPAHSVNIGQKYLLSRLSLHPDYTPGGQITWLTFDIQDTLSEKCAAHSAGRKQKLLARRDKLMFCGQAYRRINQRREEKKETR